MGLISAGRKFGDPGFYRVTDSGRGRRRVWHVRGFTEIFHRFAEQDGSVRTDHFLRWWGLPVLRLHHHITSRAPVAASTRPIAELSTG